MDLKKVLARVKVITGDERDALLLTLCGDAVRELQRRVKCDEETCKKYEDDLCAAAAARAVYQLVLLDGAQSPDSMTAGDVRAEYRYNRQQAELYLQQCMRAAAPLLRDDGFWFGGTDPWREG